MSRTTYSPLRAAIWLRVSTSEQDVANQSQVLIQWCAARNLEHVATYTLTGESAFSDNAAYTAQLNAMLDDARHRKFDVILVWALDRLSRRGIEHTLGLLHKFATLGVEVWSHQESWTETTGPARELLLAVMAWVAQQESQRRSERTKAGLARRKAAGLPIGRQVGATDRIARRRSGYIARWERERSAATQAPENGNR